jgi:hypothetical protein
VGNTLDPQEPRHLSILQGKETNKDRWLSDLARKLCRGYGHPNKRRRQSRYERRENLRSPRLRQWGA